jgi:glycosyltransferase involved in cell wall biosynthesis
MRILVLLTDAFGGHGGIALYNRDLLTALCSHPDCDEVIAIPRLMPNPSEPQPTKLTYVTDGLNSKGGYIRTVLRAVRQNPAFDLIVCGHINLIPLAMVLRTWLKVPVLLEVYGIDAWQPTKSRLINMLVRKIDAFISISDITRQRFSSWSKFPVEKGFLLPNAIHAEQYGPGPKNHALLKRYGMEGKIILMTLGRLSSDEQYKGFDEVMAVLPEIAVKIPNIAYLIVGRGDDLLRLQEKALTLGIADRVGFTGFIQETDKADHFRLADVYVMPSQGEGFGFVFLEALACGIPCVGSTLDGSREALRNGELGLLVDPKSPDQIKHAIFKSLSIEKGIPPGLDIFAFTNFSSRLHQILDTVIEPAVVQVKK